MRRQYNLVKGNYYSSIVQNRAIILSAEGPNVQPCWTQTVCAVTDKLADQPACCWRSQTWIHWSYWPTWRPVRLYSICRWLSYGVVNKTNLEPLLTRTVLVSLNKISRVVKCIRHRPLCSLEYSLTPVDFGRRNTNSRLHYIILHFKSANCPKSVALTSSENTMKRVLSL